MKTRFLSLLLAFALLINFSGVPTLAMELSIATAGTASVPSHGGTVKNIAHSDCAMHAQKIEFQVLPRQNKHATATNHACDTDAKKSHVCGSLKCDCGCHLSALTFAAISLAAASHAAKLTLFQPQRAPLPPIKLNLRPPISA